MICSNCGFQNAAGDQFCGSCGKFLEWTGAEPEPESSAGEPPSTGEPGATAADSPTTPVLTPTPTGPTPTPPAPTPQTTPIRTTTAVPPPRPTPGPGAPIVCWNCGRSNPSTRTFCQQCGERLGVATTTGAAGAAGATGVGSAGGRGGRAGPPGQASAGGGDNRGRLLAIGVAAVALLLLAGGAAAIFLGGLGGDQPTPTPTLVALPLSPSPLAAPTTSPSPFATPTLSPTAPLTLPPTAGPTAPPTPPPTPRPTRRPTPTPPPTPQPTPANCDDLAEPVDTITLTPEDPRRDIRSTRYWCVTQITFGDGVGDGLLKIFLTNPIFLTEQYGYSSERIGWNEVLMSGGTFGGSSVESPPMLIIDPVADPGRTHRLFPPGTIVEFEVTCSTPDCSGSVQINRIRRIPPPAP
ncbi:MAG TPA: zinc ribbon domain-containing protein [Candidatus Limnocylindria bacterium]|nr:zinc ribbon domain-containing protein [Candidatus Limnocylindria bacterium]